MLNYLSLLGWNDASDKEIYAVDELVESFSLDRASYYKDSIVTVIA